MSLLCLLVMSAMFYAAPPDIAAARAATVPVLGSRTAVTSEGPGVVRVRLARRLQLAGLGDAVIRHKGRGAVVMLVQQEVRNPAAAVFVSVPGRLLCARCGQHRAVLSLTRSGSSLPVGVYKLYLLSRKGRITARLPGAGPGGTTVVSADRARGAHLAVPPLRDLAGRGRYGGGVSSLAGRGTLLRFLAAGATAAGAGHVELCVNNNNYRTAVAYAPGCAPDGPEWQYTDLNSEFIAAATMDFSARRGVYGQGGNVTHISNTAGAVLIIAAIPH